MIKWHVVIGHNTTTNPQQICVVEFGFNRIVVFLSHKFYIFQDGGHPHSLVVSLVPKLWCADTLPHRAGGRGGVVVAGG